MAFLALLSDLFNLRAILVTILAFIVTYIFIVKYRQSANLPPGPWSFPIFGYLPNIAFYSRVYGLSMPALCLRLSKKYGPVFSFYLGNHLCVVLNTREAVKDAFMDPKMNDRATAAFYRESGGLTFFHIIRFLSSDWLKFGTLVLLSLY